MPTIITKACKTPFGNGSWPWNFVPVGGLPTRERCQAVAMEPERQAASKLIQRYRAQEQIAADNDIEGRQQNLDRPAHGGAKGVNSEMLRREIAKCDHGAFLAAQEELSKLRGEAVALIVPLLRRLITSLDESLSASALEAEKRIEGEQLPILNGDLWTLHTDGVCQALWFRRSKAEKALAAIEPGNAVGYAQYLLSNEEGTPFQWPS